METHAVFRSPSESQIFWGEIAPCEHLVQLYEDGNVFLDTLEGFVGGGLLAGDGIVVIATEAHLQALQMRLLANGFDVDSAVRTNQYVAVEAAEALAKFMTNGWPDERKFEGVVHNLLTRARGNGRKVRAFGEMVALLWAGGHRNAVVRLEQLWHGLCTKEAFALLCAYPKSGFVKPASISANDICQLHSKVLPG